MGKRAQRDHRGKRRQCPGTPQRKVGVPKAQKINLPFVEIPFFILKEEFALLKCRPFLEAPGISSNCDAVVVSHFSDEETEVPGGLLTWQLAEKGEEPGVYDSKAPPHPFFPSTPWLL